MQAKNTVTITQLQKEILSLQGFKQTSGTTALDIELGPIKAAFPNGTFPLGVVHEFLCASQEAAAATGGFIGGLLASLTQSGGSCLWISSLRTLFPPALKFYSIEPDRVIFADLLKESDVLWAVEEALKCGGLAAVVGEIQDMNFTCSRRLQLAVEQSRVTGFILRRAPRNLNVTACVARWKITSLPSELQDNMPGIGFPRWNVQLLKIRNGKPGSWEMEWSGGRFQHILPKITVMPLSQKMKTG